MKELAGENSLTLPVFWQTERRGRDRADKPEYKVKLSVSFCFSNTVQIIEHYHNSSWLEHGGSPEKAVKSAFVNGIDAYLKAQGKYQKSESKITWADVEDCLVLVSNNFSTQTSYENQTKKAINNKFVQEAMTEFLRAQLEVYFIENPLDAGKIAEQVLINKRSRENAERTRLNIKKSSPAVWTSPTGYRSLWTAGRRTPPAGSSTSWRATRLWAASSSPGTRSSRASCPSGAKSSTASRPTTPRSSRARSSPTSLKVLGCGVEVHDKHAKDMAAFDLMNLRWNKVVICTDADVDGFQIRTLILTMLYRLTPTLIQRGYVYIAESPCMRSPTRTRPGSPTPTRRRTRSWAGSWRAGSAPSTAPRAWARTSRT